MKRMPLVTEQRGDGVGIISSSGGMQLQYPLNKRFTLRAYGSFGYFNWNGVGWDVGEANTSSWVVKAGVGAAFILHSLFSIGVNASYEYYAQFYNGICLAVSIIGLDLPLSAEKTSVREEAEQKIKPETFSIEAQPQTKRESGLTVGTIRLKQLFPVLYKYYDEHSLGTAVLKNNELTAVEDVRLSFYVER